MLISCNDFTPKRQLHFASVMIHVIILLDGPRARLRLGFRWPAVKFCHRCQQWKDESEFAKNRAHRDGLQSQCRACKRESDRKYYEGHTAEQLARVRNRSQGIQEENARRVYQYLLTHPCVDCGESDPVVLEFDHINGDKAEAIARLVVAAYGWQTIAEEIAKCEVRCANCHRRVTAARRGTRRSIWGRKV